MRHRKRDLVRGNTAVRWPEDLGTEGRQLARGICAWSAVGDRHELLRACLSLTVSLFPQVPMNSEVIMDPVQVREGCLCSQPSDPPTHLVSRIWVSYSTLLYSLRS